MENNLTTAKDRIKYIIDLKGISKRSFYRDTGMSNGVLDQKTGLSEDNMVKFISKYPNISTLWILTGTGEIELNNTKTNFSDTIIEINPDSKSNTIVADVKASAGFGNLITQHKKIEVLPSTYLPNAPLGLNIAFQIQGDSMYPTVENLDYVAGNRVLDIGNLRDGHVYIIIDKEDGVLCKRLYREGNNLKIVSDNPNYPPYLRSFDNILGIFKAFCHFSFNFLAYKSDLNKEIQGLKNDFMDLSYRIQSLEKS